jgi:hypothetical protein
MERREAVRILQELADGRDPKTGATLPSESVFDRPDVVRALYTAIQAMKGAAGLDEHPAERTPEKRGAKRRRTSCCESSKGE